MRDGFFDESFLGAMRDPSPKSWSSIATQVHPGVYTFRVLDAAWCKRLLEEVDHFEMWSKEVSLHVNRPNSMNVSPAPWPSNWRAPGGSAVREIVYWMGSLGAASERSTPKPKGGRGYFRSCSR